MAGCAPLFTPLPANTATAQPQSLAPESLNTPTLEPPPISTTTSTEAPFILDLTPVPTETPLPTLELPTEAAFRPALQIWDGLPTYLAESRPDFYFRLHFDPDTWALTADNYGFPALAHRDLPDCLIAPTAGRGLPLNGSVEHDTHHIGSIQFQIDAAYLNGVKQFVNYTGGNGVIYTAFEVSFQADSNRCLADAEDDLGTLTSVSVSQATPIATP